MKKTNLIKALTIIGFIMTLVMNSCKKEDNIDQPSADSIAGNWTSTTVAVLKGLGALSGGFISDTPANQLDTLTAIKINSNSVKLNYTSLHASKESETFIDTLIFSGSNIMLTPYALGKIYNQDGSVVLINLDTNVGKIIGTKDSVLGIIYAVSSNLVSNYTNKNLLSFTADFIITVRIDKVKLRSNGDFPGGAAGFYGTLLTLVKLLNPTWNYTTSATATLPTPKGVVTSTFRRL